MRFAFACAFVLACLLAMSAFYQCFRAPGGRMFTANRAVNLQNLTAVAQALDQYAKNHGGIYPTNIEALLAHGEGEWGYLEGRSTWVIDPWRRPYLYEVSADGRRFRLQSLGRDGKPGGSDDDEDMSVTSKPAID
jgi:general secretion pathway protein G